MQYFKKSIIITENQIKPLLKGIILEDRESKNIHKARVYLGNNRINDYQAKQILNRIRHDIPNARLAQCKYLVGICRYYLHKELDNKGMNSILPFIANEAHVNEYDSDFNGLSFETLYNQFKVIKDKYSEESRKQSYNRTDLNRNTDYTIYKIPSFEEARKFGRYTPWCVTQEESAYKTYTNKGNDIFYFCVKNGFENAKNFSRETGNPLDEYGLSMIAISVDENGDLNTCTSRWNFYNNGNDHVMSKDQIEDLLGVNFYETFKPRYAKEEFEKIKKEKNDKIQNIIKEIIYNDKFDEEGKYINIEYNIYIWKDELVNGDIKYIVSSEIYGNKFKIFNSDLSLFTNEEFYDAYILPKKNGFLVKYNDDLNNILLPNGSLLFERRKYTIESCGNFILIQKYEDSRYEIYDYNFNKLTDETFDDIDEMNNEKLLKVYYGDGYKNILSLNGSLLLKRDVCEIKEFKNFICAKISRNSQYEIYDSNCYKLTNVKVDGVRESDGFLIFEKYGKYNVMDVNGNIMSEWYYLYIYEVKNFKGYLFYSVDYYDNYKNVYNRLGQRLFDEGVTSIDLRSDGISYRQNGNMKYIPYEEAIKRMH